MENITLENWESGRGEKPRRPRGPKPVAHGQLLRATAWLDGDLQWRDGALVWNCGSQYIVADALQIERAERALDRLETRALSAEVVASRRKNWRLARQLGALHARDFDKLCAVSRRRNPAALARLAPLFVLESLDIALPNSPARALLRAWPHSQNALQSVLENPDWPDSARELAAFIVGAAQPANIADLPKSSRAIAALGARLKCEVAAFELPRTLLKMAREDEKLAPQIVALSQSGAPFAPDAHALRRLIRAHRLMATGQIATQLCSIESEWPELPAYLEANSPAERELGRETTLLWRRTRREWSGEVARILARLALEAPAAIEPFLQGASELREAAMRVAKGSAHKRRKRRLLAPESVGVAAFVAQVTAQMPAILSKLAQLCLQTPDVAASFYLCRALAEKCRATAPAAQSHKKGAAKSSRKWLDGYRPRLLSEAEALTQLLRLAGADFAQWAWKNGRHIELARSSRRLHKRQAPEPAIVASWAQLLRDLPEITDIALWEWDRLHRRIGSGARGIVAAVLDAARDVPPATRALIVEGLFWTLPPAAHARVTWQSLPAMIRESAAILGECNDSIERATDAVVELAKHCNRLDIAPALHAPLAQIFAEVYRAHLKDKKWDDQADFAAEFALQLCPRSAHDENFLADFERTLIHVFEALYADRDCSKEVAPALKLVGNRPNLARALLWGLEVAPARALDAMEHLCALKRTHQLDSLRVLEDYAPANHAHEQVGPPEDSIFSDCLFDGNVERRTDAQPGSPPCAVQQEKTALDAAWGEVIRAAPAIADAACDYVRWQSLAGAETAPPPGALKIVAWPHKWAREIAALEGKVGANLKLLPRLENLRARLADEPKWRAQLERELAQSLENATKRAAFAALERVIERAFRSRLRELCGDLPAHFAFDDDWFNALLLGTDIQYNRKWARALLRHEVAGTAGWREKLPGNAQFLAALSARGVDQNFYLSEFGRARGELFLWLETRPLGILQMGNRFNTCLSRGGCNSFAGVANAIELNKRVVYARDKNGHIVARQLWAVSADYKLLGFHIYSTFSGAERAGLEAQFAAHAREFVRSCGLELADVGTIETLVAPQWYDDGACAWERNEADNARNSKRKAV